MPQYSNASKQKLLTSHNLLQQLFNEVIKYVDISIICGYRDKLWQDKAFKEKCSKVKWPNSKHNSRPSLAIDFAPYPDTKNSIDYVHIAGIIIGIASMLDIPIKYGADWNKNFRVSDETFLDCGHIELLT